LADIQLDNPALERDGDAWAPDALLSSYEIASYDTSLQGFSSLLRMCPL
jgi:hypothetical protein